MLHNLLHSKQHHLNTHTTCDCGRNEVHIDTIMMDPKSPGTRTCPMCRAESKEIADAFDLITS